MAAMEARVGLRPLSRADRHDILKILQHPEVEKKGAFRFEESDFDSLLSSMESPHWAGQSFAVIHDATGITIGTVGLERRPGGEASLMYAFHPDYWGKGYASEAVTLLVDKAFYEYGFTKLRAITRKENRDSVALLERIGFHHVREIPIGPVRAPEIYLEFSLEKAPD